MKKIVLFAFILVMLFTLYIHPVFADGPQLTSEDTTRILKALNPHIISYDVNTHIVTYDNYKPVFVTPPGYHPQNGEVTWDYFIVQKGDLRGWLKLPFEEMIKEKARIVKEFDERNGISSSGSGDLIQTTSLPDSKYVSITQYPQECNNWRGPASTKSVLSGWGITQYTQSQIASREGVPCGANYGAGLDAIASALNYYASTTFYSVTHFGDQQQFWQIFLADIGSSGRAFVGEGYTDFLYDWRNHKNPNRVHYTAPRGYWTPTDSTPVENDWQQAQVAYVDPAANSPAVGYTDIHAYVSQDFIDKNGDGYSYYDYNYWFPTAA